jgi:hypothetical protein
VQLIRTLADLFFDFGIGLIGMGVLGLMGGLPPPGIVLPGNCILQGNTSKGLFLSHRRAISGFGGTSHCKRWQRRDFFASGSSGCSTDETAQRVAHITASIDGGHCGPRERTVI